MPTSENVVHHRPLPRQQNSTRLHSHHNPQQPFLAIHPNYSIRDRGGHSSLKGFHSLIGQQQQKLSLPQISTIAFQSNHMPPAPRPDSSPNMASAGEPSITPPKKDYYKAGSSEIVTETKLTVSRLETVGSLSGCE